MTGLQAVGVLLAGVFAGTINAVVGSGTLVTFPALLAAGLPPVTANVSNTVGLVPGSLTGIWGYRRELEGQRGRLIRLASATLLGAVLGAILLLTLPPQAFQAVVPVLIAIALVLVVLGPRLSRALIKRRGEPHPHGGVELWIGVFLTGVYGGYFGAAQGVLLVGLMGVLMTEDLQRINAAKNVLGTLANLVAGIVFIAVAHVDWLAALLIAVGSAVGGLIGSKIGRRLPPIALRGLIVVVGTAAIVKLVVFS